MPCRKAHSAHVSRMTVAANTGSTSIPWLRALLPPGGGASGSAEVGSGDLGPEELPFGLAVCSPPPAGAQHRADRDSRVGLLGLDRHAKRIPPEWRVVRIAPALHDDPQQPSVGADLQLRALLLVVDPPCDHGA